MPSLISVAPSHQAAKPTAAGIGARGSVRKFASRELGTEGADERSDNKNNMYRLLHELTNTRLGFPSYNYSTI